MTAARRRATRSTHDTPRTRGRHVPDVAPREASPRPATRREALPLLPNVVYRSMVQTLLG
ncbi:MAG: hypothetical protein ACODAJ_17110 [Planctomycetota bacterium]